MWPVLVPVAVHDGILLVPHRQALLLDMVAQLRGSKSSARTDELGFGCYPGVQGKKRNRELDLD